MLYACKRNCANRFYLNKYIKYQAKARMADWLQVCPLDFLRSDSLDRFHHFGALMGQKAEGRFTTISHGADCFAVQKVHPL